MADSTRITLTFPKDMFEYLEETAKDNETSIASVVRLLIRESMKTRETNNALMSVMQGFGSHPNEFMNKFEKLVDRLCLDDDNSLNSP